MIQNNGIEKPWNWLSLLFSVFYFFSFFYQPLTFYFVSGSLLFFGLFVGLYQRLASTKCRHQLVLIIAMALLGVVASSFNPSASMFFGYANFFAGYYLPPKRAFILATSIIFTLFATAYTIDLWVSYYIFPGLIPAIALALMGAFIRQADEHKYKQQQSEQERHQLAAVAERERIARDLHDTLGHTLSSIALKAQLARKLGDRGDITEALTEISEVAALASATLSDVRGVISGYRQKGLTGHVETLCKRLANADFTVDTDNHLAAIPPALEASIILMVTEAVTNIIRHSNGNHARISLQQQDTIITISVYDNGSAPKTTPGNGLSGIAERLVELDGQMSINTNSGFLLSIRVPSQAL